MNNFDFKASIYNGNIFINFNKNIVDKFEYNSLGNTCIMLKDLEISNFRSKEKESIKHISKKINILDDDSTYF